MDMMTMTMALDKATRETTAFNSFEELCQAGLGGYAPTLRRGEQRSIGAAFDARMTFEGVETRAYWRD
jgi:hypothetical protein